MATPRFHCAEPLTPGNVIELPDSAAIHASKALRMQTGDDAILFNGDGQDYLCTLTVTGKTSVSAQIRSSSTNDTESVLGITLLQAISTGDRMDFSIQKAVELGVTAIQPIISQRSVVRLSGERAEKRREHWQNVAIAACAQSGRARIPIVAAAVTLDRWLARQTLTLAALRIVLSPMASQSLHQFTQTPDDIYLLVGAEGGLSEAEINLATAHHFIPVRMGRRILRTETAALTAISAMQTLWGDFN